MRRGREASHLVHHRRLIEGLTIDSLLGAVTCLVGKVGDRLYRCFGPFGFFSDDIELNEEGIDRAIFGNQVLQGHVGFGLLSLVYRLELREAGEE